MTKKTLIVASLRFNVYENHVSSPESRLQFVTRCVHDICGRYPTDSANHLLVITGPEYMFARKNYTLSDFNRNEFKAWDPAKAPTFTPGAKPGQVVFSDTDNDMEEGLKERRKTAYSEKEKDSIIKKLIALSSAYPNLLLVPGTIMWREYLYLKKLTKRKSPVFNTAPVISNGQEVHLYDKKNDSDEIKADYRLRNTDFGDQAERYRFSPGVATGLFEWKGLKCGIEICVDHEKGTLKKELGDGQKPNLHLMLSAGMTPKKENSCAGIGGFLVSNDGSKGKASQQVNCPQATGLLSSQDPASRDNDWVIWELEMDY